MERPPGRRISICGPTGSGKTTLGRQVGECLGLPHIELDEIYHLPNWGIIEVEPFRAKVSEIVAADEWVVVGNYRKVRDLVHARADTIVWLDYPFWFVFQRLARRCFVTGIRRDELWNGNRESFWRHFFTPDSLLIWLIRTYRRHRRDADALEDAANSLTFIRFRSARETETWLRSL